MSLIDTIIKSVLCEEENYLRFEDFSCDILSEINGLTYLRTSKTSDFGRDGRCYNGEFNSQVRQVSLVF